ncbi:phage tail protein [bacterium]|nr:phage tail protein [bacterium]
MGLLQKTTTISTPETSLINGLDDINDYPIPSFQFSLEIGDATVALFQSISGLSVTRNLETITEGGVNNQNHELPGSLSYGHVTFKNGLSSPDFFLKWMLDGQYIGYANKGVPVTLVQRRTTKDGTVDFLTWSFSKPIPVSWSISDLTVTDSNSIVIETLEIAFEYFTLEKI